MKRFGEWILSSYIHVNKKDKNMKVIKEILGFILKMTVYAIILSLAGVGKSK